MEDNNDHRWVYVFIHSKGNQLALFNEQIYVDNALTLLG